MVEATRAPQTLAAPKAAHLQAPAPDRIAAQSAPQASVSGLRASAVQAAPEARALSASQAGPDSEQQQGSASRRAQREILLLPPHPIVHSNRAAPLPPGYKEVVERLLSSPAACLPRNSPYVKQPLVAPKLTPEALQAALMFAGCTPGDPEPIPPDRASPAAAATADPCKQQGK